MMKIMDSGEQTLNTTQENFVASQLSAKKRWPILVVIVFAVLELTVFGLVGFGSYFLGRTTALQEQASKTQSEQTADQQAAPQIPVQVPAASPSAQMDLNSQIFSGKSGVQYKKSIIGDYEALKKGYPSNNQNPEVEVFVFADVTEGSFSGKILKDHIDFLINYYPQARVWYLHTVLPYRDMANERAWMSRLECIAAQGKIWENMPTLAEYAQTQNLENFTYALTDYQQFSRCVADLEKKTDYLNEQILASQARMSSYAVTGIPTIMFVSPTTNKTVTVVGAIPFNYFQQDIAVILTALQ